MSVTLVVIGGWLVHILFVAPYPPSRIRMRSFGFITQLARSHSVEVVALCVRARDLTDIEVLRNEGVSVTIVYEPRFARFFRSFVALPSFLPLQVAYDASPRLRAIIQDRLHTQHFDLMHVEFIRSLGALPAHLPLPVVWDAVDCISQLYVQGAQVGVTLIQRLIAPLEVRRVRIYERTQLYRFREILVTAERERQALLDVTHKGGAATQKRALANITIIPHGIDREYFCSHTGTRQRDLLIFSGKMSYHANIAGVQHLVRNILPLIWRQRPQVKLLIAGSDPPLSLRWLARDARVSITGYVPDLRPFLAQASVAVCPLPYAVGLQTKVLEAMATGIPVVASSCVAAGLQQVTPLPLLVADEPELFAAAVLQLLEDRSLQSDLSAQGIHYVAMHYDWEQIVQRLLAVYVRVLGGVEEEISHDDYN